jgi:hypothetical protein
MQQPEKPPILSNQLVDQMLGRVTQWNCGHTRSKSRWPNAKGTRWIPTPNYLNSTEWAVAGVVGTLRKEGWLITVKWMPADNSYILGGGMESEYGGPEPKPVFCLQGKVVASAMFMGEPYRHDEMAYDDTAPRAICKLLAAIRGVEIRKGK